MNKLEQRKSANFQGITAKIAFLFKCSSCSRTFSIFYINLIFNVYLPKRYYIKIKNIKYIRKITEHLEHLNKAPIFYGKYIRIKGVRDILFGKYIQKSVQDDFPYLEQQLEQKVNNMAKVLTRNRNKNTGKAANWEYRFEGASVNGKRKHISKSGFRTQKEAYAAGIKALNEYENGTHIESKDMSVSDYFDEWIDKYVKVNLRHKTQASYIGIVENHIKPTIGHYKLKSLNPSQLQEFANGLKTKGFSKRHIVNIMSTVTNALNYAIEPLQYIKYNPAKLVKLPKVEREPRQRIVLSPEDWKRIIGRFPFGNKYHIPLIIGYHTGLRIGEVFGLTWNDVDLENGMIYVNKQSIRYKADGEKAKWCLGATKTKSSVRAVKIDSTLTKVLRQENIRQKQNRLLYGKFYTSYDTREIKGQNLLELIPTKGGKIDLICVQDDGTLLTTDSFKYCSRVIHHELKIEFDFHSLRHTHATILVENGADIKNVQKRLGHEKIETTLQTYVHDTDEMSERSVEIFERALSTQK